MLTWPPHSSPCTAYASSVDSFCPSTNVMFYYPLHFHLPSPAARVRSSLSSLVDTHCDAFIRSVVNRSQSEALWRRYERACRGLLLLKCGRYLLWGPLAAAHRQQSPHHLSHLAVEEALSFHSHIEVLDPFQLTGAPRQQCRLRRGARLHAPDIAVRMGRRNRRHITHRHFTNWRWILSNVRGHRESTTLC